MSLGLEWFWHTVINNWNSENAVCENLAFWAQNKAEKEKKVDLGEYTEDYQHSPLKYFIGWKRKPKPALTTPAFTTTSRNPLTRDLF